MLVVVLVSALLILASADNPKDDAQYMNLSVKSVKGGGGSYTYRGGDNLNRFFNQTQHGYVQAHLNHEVGVCYIEVPTSTLVRDPKHIPAGNGSRSDLSRIRTCCAGYIRNIHNYLICDPVCTTECVNSLCTAPNTCTCFPDHVKNSAGFCVATCPIGCQNGHCNGGQCLCKEGFKLDVGGKFCVPHCRENCGGIGNCTAPNLCECRPGYSSTPEGSCRTGGGASHPGLYPGYSDPNGPYPGHNSQLGGPSVCGPCINGQCVGTECRCRQGYLLYKGECKALCTPSCSPNTECVAPNVCAPKGTSGVNATNPNNGGPVNYPYPTPNTPYQNPGQGNAQWRPEGQYPYPNGQNPNNNQWGQTNHGQPNGTYPSQGQYPQPGRTYPSQDQYTQPGQQHLYPSLPSNTYPYAPSRGKPNGTDGQVYYQNQPLNPLANVTFNLQQGGSDQTLGHGQNATQGHYGGGQYSQGQFGYEQNSAGQYSHGQTNQGQYGQGQYSQGQYGQGQYSQGQFGQGQYSQGQYGQGQYSQGQYGQGQTNQGQYGQGQYGQGQYSQGQNNNGQYGQGQQQGSYGQNLTEGGQISSNGFGNCEQPCLNGNCVGHNTCECFPGYNLDPADFTRSRCVPYCAGGCLNGYCASPNNCACAEGYHKDFSVKGRSACVKRVRRSTENKPVNIAELLVFEIPDYE